MRTKNPLCDLNILEVAFCWRTHPRSGIFVGAALEFVNPLSTVKAKCCLFLENPNSDQLNWSLKTKKHNEKSWQKGDVPAPVTGHTGLGFPFRLPLPLILVVHCWEIELEEGSVSTS